MADRFIRDLLQAEIADMEHLSAERHKSKFLDDREEVEPQTLPDTEVGGVGGVSKGLPPRPLFREGDQ